MSLDEKKVNHSQSKPELKRQKSLIKISKKVNTSQSIQKFKKENPYRNVIIEKEMVKPMKRQEKQPSGLTKMKSHKELKKKAVENRLFYKLKK